MYIICIGEEAIRHSIIKNLKNNKVKSEKIFDFYDIYMKRYFSKKLDLPLKKIDRVLYNNNQNYDGIILGLSHAAFGINPEYLDKRFCNLAVPMEDLYYNLRTLQILNYKYKNNIKNLKYVIFDM